MNKPLKITLLSILGLCALLIVAAVIFIVTFNPNDYKQLISEQVQKATGRTLILSGNVELSVFPWIGITTGPLTLSNPEGFTGKEFLQARNAELHAQLRPLFNKELLIEKVVISSPVIALERNQQGAENWVFTAEKQDKAQSGQPASAQPVSETGTAADKGLAALTIEAVEITDATISYTDSQTGDSFSANDINLLTGSIAPGKATDVTFRAFWSLAEPDIRGSISLKTALSIDSNFSVIEAKGAQLRAMASGPMFSRGDADMTLESDIRFDMHSKQLTVQNINASLWDTALKGNVDLDIARTTYNADIVLQSALQDTLQKLGIALQPADTFPTLNVVTQVQGNAQTAKVNKLEAKLDKTTLTGKAALNIANTSYNADVALQSPLRDTLQKLGVILALPPEALAELKLNTQIEGTAKAITIKTLKGSLDETNFSGNASLVNFSRPNIKMQLTADKLNLDNYLAEQKDGEKTAPAKEQTETPKGTQSSEAILSPEMRKKLQELTLLATVKLGQLQAKGFNASDILVQAKADNGVLSIDPFSLLAYGGSLSSKASVDVKPEKPSLAAAMTVADIQVEEPVTLLAEKKVLSGVLSSSLNITGQGLQWPAMASSLQGKGALSLTQGIVHGVEIIPKETASHLREGSQAKRLDKAAKQQRFDSLTATVIITDGKATNNDMLLSSHDLKGTGAGWADLANDKVDYRANLQVTGLPVIPVKVSGSLTKPKYGLDAGQFTTNILKGVGNLLKAPAETGVESLEDVGGLLKQMFGRPKK